MKSRVLVTRFPYFSRRGGEEWHSFELMQALDDRGIEAFFLGSCPVLYRMFREAGFISQFSCLPCSPVTLGSLIRFTLIFPFAFLKAGWLLWLAKRQWKVDSVYMLSFSEKLLMTPWAALFGLRVLWLEHARLGRWFYKNPWRMWYSFCSRWATVVVTSDAMLPAIEPFVRRAVSVPCAVLTEEARPLRAEILEFLKGGFAMATVARLSEDKGVDMVVRLVQSKPETRLVVVGDGPLESCLKSMVGEGQVLFVKELPRAELFSLYKRLDLFVLASREFDPFGMVAAEAMWMGAPVLMTTACGFSQELTDERQAKIVEPRFAELDRAVKFLMRHPEFLARMGEEGRAFVRAHHRLEPMVSAFAKLLRK